MPIRSLLRPGRTAACLVAFLTLCGLAAAEDRFPKPDPAQAYAGYKIFATPGDPLRRPAEDWEGARRRTAEDPAWARWLRDRRREQDDWMAKRRDHVEWVAGWWHDFVSPKDGSFLNWTPDEPGPLTLASRSDPAVPLTPKLHAAWVYGFRSRHAERILEAARLYRLTNGKRYADWAADQLDFYAEHFRDFPAAEKGRSPSDWRSRPRLMWQSLDEANVLTRHVQAVRLLGDAVSQDRRRAWFEKLFRPQCEGLEASLLTIHNIACWHRSAVAQTALVYDDATLWKAALEGRFGIRNQIREGVTSDYLWYEQSLGYNAYVAQALTPLFVTASLVGRQEELRPEMLAVENLLLSPFALRFPDGRMPTPADANRGRGHDDAGANLARFYRTFPTPQGLIAAQKLRDWDTLLDPPPPAPSDEAPLPPVATRNFESSRMAVLVHNGWQVFVHYGQLTGSHAQSEALNFETTWNGLDVTHDPGTVGYGSPLHREYYTHGLAHNVPLVGGQGQSGWNAGVLSRFDAEAAALAAIQPRYQPGAWVKRTLRIEGDALVDEVEVQAANPRAGDARPPVGLALHLQGKVDLPPGFEPAPTFADGRAAGYRQWREARTATFRDRADLTFHIGSQAFRLTLTVSGPFRVTHASTPDTPPGRRESLLIETDRPEAEFHTTIAPLR